MNRSEEGAVRGCSYENHVMRPARLMDDGGGGGSGETKTEFAQNVRD